MIRLKKISYTYGNDVVALRDVDLIIRENECIGIVGENGSGKTTFGKILGKLLLPSTGQIILEPSGRPRTPFLYVYQYPEYQIFQDMVEKEILLSLDQKQMNEEEETKVMDFYLRLFGLAQYRKSSPLELSYGLKKLLTIAVTMAMEPELIIIDEPTVGIDREGQRRLDVAIWRRKKSKMATVIISHDVEFILKHSDRILFFENGGIIFDGNKIDFIKKLIATRQNILEIPPATKIAKYILGIDDIFFSINDIVDRVILQINEGKFIQSEKPSTIVKKDE